MKQFIKYLAIIASVLILTACGSNSKENPGSSSSTTIPSGGLIDDTTSGSSSSGSNDAADNLGYKIINATAFVTISEPSTQYNLKLQVVKNDFAVSGKTFTLKAFDNPNDKYGTFSSISATTDAQGYATFSYTSPAALSDINGSSRTLEVISNESEDNVTVELSQKFVLTFNAKSQDDNDDTNTTTEESSLVFKNATTPLTVTNVETKYTFKVQLIDSETKFAVSGETVTLQTFENQFDKYGAFTSLSATTDALGYATFNYTSPKDINLTDLELTAVLVSAPDIVQPFVIKFDEDAIDNNQEEEVDKPFIVIANSSKAITLTSNSQQESISVRVFSSENAPYSEGSVKVALPDKITTGVDVGSFESYSVGITNGVATFNYTGPQNLSELINSGDSSSVFKFYHEANPTQKESTTVTYSPTSDEYIPINYSLEVTSEDGEFTMGIPNKEKTFSIVLKDDKGDNVAEDKMVSINVQSQNSYVGKLLNNGIEVPSLSKTAQNPVSFVVRTNLKSGLIPIKIEATVKDPNNENETRTYSKTINIIVYSGPPTAMSISYVGVEQDGERAKYVERYAVTATDAYNNRVNTAPSVATGAIVGYAVDGSTNPATTPIEQQKQIYYGKGEANASITPTVTGNESLFKITPTVGQEGFNYIDEANDKLVIFGEGYLYEALGKWDFEKLSNTELLLKDNYFGAYRENLYYAIGHNYRQDPCRNDGTEYVGSASVSADTPQLDEEGTAIIEFSYDYHLTGKDIMLWVNLNGYQADTDTTTRIGESKKVTLRGNGLISEPTDGYKIDANLEGNVRFTIWHESAPEYYRNAHFGWQVTSSTTCEGYSIVDTTNNYDARSCNNNGVGYIEFYIPKQLEDCTFNIEKILASREF